jgi:hypothetical protein
MWTSKPVTNVQATGHALTTFNINPLIHIHQKKEKIAPSVTGLNRAPLLPWESMVKSHARFTTTSQRYCTNEPQHHIETTCTKSWFSRSSCSGQCDCDSENWFPLNETVSTGLSATASTDVCQMQRFSTTGICLWRRFSKGAQEVVIQVCVVSARYFFPETLVWTCIWVQSCELRNVVSYCFLFMLLSATYTGHILKTVCILV